MVELILKNIIVLLFMIIFLINLVSSSVEINLDVKPVFYEGSTIEFSYRFISSQDEKIKYFAGINCEDANFPGALLEIKEIDLKKNESFNENYTFGEVDTSFARGKCNASITVLEPYLLIKEELFEVSTKPSFSFEIKLDKNVFMSGENIYLNYSSEIKSPSIIAVLTYPDKTSKEVNLPISIKAEQIGTYELEVTASKEGYKTIIKKEQFGVIEKQAEIKEDTEIKEVSLENQTAVTPIAGKGNKKNINLIILGLIAGILLIIVLVYFLLKKNRN